MPTFSGKHDFILFTTQRSPVEKVVTFYNLVQGGVPPQRATRCAGGTLPVRGFRYCEPVTTASAFGWYIFLARKFAIVWDGVESIWSYDGGLNWYPLVRAAQYPDFAQNFDAAAPQKVRGFSPPFLTMTESGFLQVWTGVIARTAPDWSLLIRAPANISRSLGYDLMEGVVETDRWFGPLFTNVQLRKTSTPIYFAADRPFLQVQPLYRENYSERILNSYQVISGAEGLTEEEWDRFYQTVVVPSSASNRKKGRHGVEVRKRRVLDEQKIESERM